MKDVYMAYTHHEGSPDFCIRVYLINPTDCSYLLSLVRDTGIGWGKSFSQKLKAGEFIRIDELTGMGQLDFTTTYDFILTDLKDESHVMVADAHLNGWNYSYGRKGYLQQPILNLPAKPVELEWKRN